MIVQTKKRSSRLSPQDKQKLKAADAEARERMHQQATAVEFYRRRENLSSPEPERLGTVIERLLSINADLVQPQESTS